MLKLSLAGAILLGVTVLIHAAGTTYWFRHLTSRYGREGPWPARTVLTVLITTALVLFGLHIIEITLWATVYYAVLPAASAWTFEQAVYFSLVTFTTLGYGDITLGPQWRLLSAIEALNGILLVGWSTAMLFALIQRIWQTSQHPAGKPQAG